MFEKLIGLFTGADRNANAGVAIDEPSHIHVPRRRRVARPDDANASASWGASVVTQEFRAAPLDMSDRQPA